MKKIVNINGMHCKHCAASVKEELEKNDKIKSAKVDHAKNCAVITVDEQISSEEVSAAVSAAGFEFVSMEDKKGLF